MKVLHLEDNPQDAELVDVLLREEWPDCEITVVDTRADFFAQLRQSHDVILSDFTLASFNGLEALKLTRELSPDTPFVFVSGSIGEERAIEAVRNGAHDYVIKDRMKRLNTSIRRALNETEESHRRRAAEEGHHRLTSILESTPDLVAMTAASGRVFYLNHAGRIMLGLAKHQDSNSLSLRDLYPSEVVSQINSEMIPAAIRDGTWSGETTLLTREGRRVPVSQVIIAHKSLAGAVEYLSIILRDLTASKAAEHRIRELADFINKCREAITVTDLDDRYTFWNEGAEHLTGWTANEVLGKTTQELYGNSSPAADTLQVVTRAGEWRGEINRVTKAGGKIVMDEHITLIRDEMGRPKAFLRIGSDVTARKMLEDQFLRVQRLEMIGMLAAGIAHDLNNVLAPIVAATPLLCQHATDPTDIKLLGVLEKNAERGTSLVRQILTFARGTAGEQRPLQIKTIIQDLIVVVERTFPKSIVFEHCLPSDLCLVTANSTQIHQVLLNLCVNARDAMPGGGTLRLRVQNVLLDEPAVRRAPPGAYLLLEVEDTGTGIPADVLEHIWEPFFTTKQAEKGTGLGLSTVRGIVEHHRGFIDLNTKVNGGTTVAVYLPAIEATTAPEIARPVHAAKA